MAKEKLSYRDNLERIAARFPNREMIKLKEAAEFLGLDVRTVKKHFTFNSFNCISVATLAREMS